MLNLLILVPLLSISSYTLDRMDNRLSEDRQHNALQDQWAYDSLYRVLDQKRDVPDAGGNPAEERAWTLDGPGNWTSLGISTFGKNAKTTTLTQSLNPLNSYTAFGGVAQADDLDGNKIDDGRFLYAWDFLHRLREVHCKTGGELIATYLCDAYGGNTALNGSGRRVRKIVSADKHGCSGTFEALKETDEMPGDSEDANDPGAEKSFAKRKASDIRYLYDGMACIEERNGSTDKVLRQYVNGARVNEHLTMDVYASDGVKLKGTLFYHEDAKGWIVALTDKTGKLKERVSYDAFGLPRFENAKGKASGNQTQSKFGNPYLYGGSYFDLETRLFLMGHRFYSPAEGRFISRDPIGIWGDRGSRGNPYVYIGVNGWDPDGLAPYWGGGWNPGNWYRWAYTGDPNTPDEAYDAALQASGVGVRNAAGGEAEALTFGLKKGAFGSDPCSQEYGQGRFAATVSRELLVTAGTMGAAQWARGGSALAVRTYQGMQLVNATQSGYAIGSGSREIMQGNPWGAVQVAAGGLGVWGGYSALREIGEVGGVGFRVSVQGEAAGLRQILFKSAHAARHLEGTGLTTAQVESAILQRIPSDASVVGGFWGRVSVGGRLIEYRAFPLPSGAINVGTYYPVPAP